MSHKTIVKIAIVMLIVFGVTVVVYPMLFNPDDKAKMPAAVPAASAPVAPAGN